MNENKITWSEIDKIIDRVREEKIEIELEVNAESQRVTVRPYQPLVYACPYREQEADA